MEKIKRAIVVALLMGAAFVAGNSEIRTDSDGEGFCVHVAKLGFMVCNEYAASDYTLAAR